MAQFGVRNLTEGKIFNQLIQLAMPIMATNFIQMAYTLTDMAWVGRLGSEEVAAIGSVGILIWLASSFAILTKIGAEISIAQSIGSNQLDKAKKYASHAVTMSFLIGITGGIVLFLGASEIISFYKLESHIAEMATRYLQVVALALPFLYGSNTFCGVYNGAGRTVIPFYLIASGLVFNMILDPLFILGIGSWGGWGVEGAGLATLVSQVLVVLLFVWQMKGPRGILNRFPYWVKLEKSYTLRIFKLGAPIAAMNCFMAAISFSIARISSTFGGHLAVMCQTTGSQIEGITWNTSNGFSTALGTFAAQNYAAGKIVRTQKAYRYTFLTLLSLGLIVTFAFVYWGEGIFGIFVPEVEAKIAGGEYLFIVAFCQIFMMLESTTLGMWNGYGKTIPPAIISMFFNFLRIPLALVFAPTYGVVGIWWTLTVTAILKGLVSACCWQIVSKRYLRKKS